MFYGHIVGNVGGDAELRYSQGGTAVMRFSVASNYRKRDADGEWQDRVEWVRVIVFGNRAESLKQHEIIQKGIRVAIHGNVEADPWIDNSNNARAGLQILAQDIQVMSPRDDSGNGGGSRGWGNDMTGQPSGRSRPATTNNAGAGSDDDLEDLPFFF